MKICYLVPSITQKAPVLVALDLAREMSFLGHDVTVYYFDDVDSDIHLPKNVDFIKISFFEKIDIESFDIVHSHMLRPDLYVFFHKKINGGNTRYITTLHNYVKEDLRYYYNSIISFLFSFIWNVAWTRHDKLVALSKDAVSYYKELSFNKRITYAYNGRSVEFDYASIPNELKTKIGYLKDDGYLIIGTYCVISKRKGIDLLLGLVKRKEKLAIVIIGDGPEKDALVAMAKELDIYHKCMFIPSTPVAQQYNSLFDIYAIPSRSEGFGLALIEAALHGKSIICSDIPIFREIFDDSAVTYFTLDDDLSLDEALDVSLKKPQKAMAALSMAKKYYSAVAMANKYQSIYIDSLYLDPNK